MMNSLLHDSLNGVFSAFALVAVTLETTLDAALSKQCSDFRCIQGTAKGGAGLCRLCRNQRTASWSRMSPSLRCQDSVREMDFAGSCVWHSFLVLHAIGPVPTQPNCGVKRRRDLLSLLHWLQGSPHLRKARDALLADVLAPTETLPVTNWLLLGPLSSPASPVHTAQMHTVSRACRS